MVRPVFLRRVGAVVALLGIGCLLIALVLPWTHEETRSRPYDYSLWFFLITSFPLGRSGTLVVLILYLLPLLGACLVAVEGLRAWQGRAATRSGIALLLLGMGCALCGLIASHLLVGISIPSEVAPPLQHSAGPGVGLASLGFSAVVAGGVLLAAGALLHRWTVRHTDRRAAATTTG